MTETVRPRLSTPRAMKVLVVEDNIINQRLVVGLLSNLGHTGVVVGDGEKALRALVKLKFDVVLMDVMMPVMDGMAALRVIRENEQTQGGHVPIVMVTSHDEPGDAARFKKAGADGYLPKPISVDLLQQELARFA